MKNMVSMLLTFIICYVVDAIIDIKKYTDFFVLPGYKVPIFILITISILFLYLRIYYSKIKYLYCTLLILCALGVFYDGYLFFIGLAGFLDLKKVDVDSKRGLYLANKLADDYVSLENRSLSKEDKDTLVRFYLVFLRLLNLDENISLDSIITNSLLKNNSYQLNTLAVDFIFEDINMDIRGKKIIEITDIVVKKLLEKDGSFIKKINDAPSL